MIMACPRSPRALALHLVHGDQEIVAPPMPDLEPNSPEALAFLAELKEPHYASLAQTIDLLFDHVMARIPSRPPDGLIKPRQGYFRKLQSYTPWEELSEDFRATFTEAREVIQDTPTYKRTEAFTEIIGTLDPARYIDLAWQMFGGISTAVNSTVTLVKEAPRIVQYHNPDRGIEAVDSIMRHPASTILLRRMAKISINQMMAAQYALVTEPENSEHDANDQQLRPELFRVIRYRNGTESLDYADFSSLEVPSGYSPPHISPHHPVEPVDKPTLIGDIKSHQSITIGCPITLLTGRLAELIDWTIDVAERRNLCEQSKTLVSV